MAKLKIKIGNDREIFIKVNLFDNEDEINIDQILRIDFQNLVPEILTFAALLNKFGILLADAESILREARLDFEIWRAKHKESIRNEWSEEESEKKRKYTISEVDDALIRSPIYRAKNIKMNKLQKERDYVNSIYWAAKDKSGKLEKLSLTILPDEIDFNDLVSEFNGVRIKVKKPLIS